MKNPQKRRKKWCVGPEKVVRKPWGRPLVDYAVVVNLIGSTQTRTGLRVEAELNTNTYENGIEVTDQEMESLRLKRENFRGD